MRFLTHSSVALSKQFAANNVWLHIDAAWGGAFMVCPENRQALRGKHVIIKCEYIYHASLVLGIERANSIVVNAHKSLLVAFDCACMWVQDRTWLLSALTLRMSWFREAH